MMTQSQPARAGAPTDSWTTGLFARLARACDQHGVAMLVAALLLSVASIVLTVRYLGFTTDRNDVLETRDRFHQNYLALKREFGVDDEIVVVVRGPDAEHNRQAVDAVAAVLSADSPHFSSVLEKIDLDFVRSRLLLYLPLDALEGLETRLRVFAPLIRRVQIQPGLVPLFRAVDDELRAALETAVSEVRAGRTPHVDTARTRDMGQALPILARLVEGMTASLQPDYVYRSVWMTLLPAAARSADLPPLEELPRAQYFSFDQGRLYLLMVVPRLDPTSSNPTGERIALLRSVLDKVKPSFPDVEFGVTGKPALENEEFVIAIADSERATVVSFLGVVLLFLLTFRHLVRPALAMACLMMALSWTMGFTTLVIGRLNILTVTAMPMLVGLGIDFGIQVVCRYGEERSNGLPPLEAMRVTLSGTGGSIVAAGITTSASFYAAYLTEFKGFQQLALLSGTGLIFCLVCMLTVYPALILMVERSEMRRGAGSSSRRASPLAGLATAEAPLLARPAFVVVLGLALMVAAIGAAVHLQFDANALRLQADGVSAVQWERRVYHASHHGLLYAAVVADNVEQARVLQRRLERLPTVATVTSPAILIPEDQDRKIEIVSGIHALMADIPSVNGPIAPVETDPLRIRLEDLRSLFLVIFQEAKKAGGAQVADDLRGFVFSLDGFLQRLAGLDGNVAAARIEAFQRALFRDLDEKLDLLRGTDPVAPVTLNDIPAGLRGYMIGRSGKALLRVFPREDVWDQQPMERFLHAIETVYPGERITGSAMQVYMAAMGLRRSCQLAEAYAMIVIVATLLVHFRSLFLALLGMLPLALGMAWTGGIMYAFGINLNPANYMALPLILGIGVANGVYVVRRFQEEGSPALFTVSTGRAIVLSNLTAMIGFGSLVVARHAGMRSLGIVMTIGVAMCALAALTVLSSLLALLQRKGGLRGTPTSE